mgnify:CR=1 FL=1
MCKNCKRLRSAAFAAIRTVIRQKPAEDEAKQAGMQDAKHDVASQEQ